MLTQRNTTSSREVAIRLARDILEKKPVYIDTETTGLNSKAEIIEIAIIDHDGTVLFQSLAKPKHSNPNDTSHIHGITVEMLNEAKSWPLVLNEMRGFLFARFIGIYNVNFDLKMIEQTNKIYHIPRLQYQTFDIMEIFAQFQGVWNKQFRSYQLFKQEAAAKICGIEVNNLHRAVVDALLARNILCHIAEADITP